MTNPNRGPTPSRPAHVAHGNPALSRLRVLLLLLALALAAATSILNPLFEAPDERLHYQFVRYLLDERALPLQPQDDTLTQYHQPPLYYLLGALFVAPMDDTGIDPLPNPFWLTYEPGEVHRDNKAQFLPQEAYAFPYRSTALGMHLLRLWSLLLLVGTLLLFLRIARQLWPENPRRQLLLFALAGLNPMFLYIGSSANNDNMVVFLSTLLLWLVIRGTQRGFSLRLALLIGLVWGLAALSKITGIFLIAPWAAALAWDAWQRRAWRDSVLYAVVISGVALSLSGWWYLRNIRLYGELFGMERMLDIWGERLPGEMDWPTLLATGRYALDTFWGRFGYGQIVLPVLFYLLFALLALAGLWGLLTAVRRVAGQHGAPASGPWLALLATVAAYLPALVYFIWRNPSGANGRYTFPALAACAAFIVLGVSHLPFRRYLIAAVTLFMVAAALVSLAWLVPWTYAAPLQRAEVEVPELDRSDELFWEQGMRLVSTQLEEHDLSGQDEPELALTACWRSDSAPGENYVLYVHVVDQAFNVLGGRDTHPGLGNFPTSLWQPGDTFCDRYRVPLPGAPQTVQVAGVVAGFYDPDTDQQLQAYDSSGAPLELAVLDHVKLGRPQRVTDPTEALASFDQGLSLQRYEWSDEMVAPGQEVTLRVWWAASGPTADSYTIFAHLSDAGAELLAQDDQLPREGRYPTTFWGQDEVISDSYTFTIPATAAPGATTVSLGFYRLADNRRLARLDTNSPPDAVVIPGPIVSE